MYISFEIYWQRRKYSHEPSLDKSQLKPLLGLFKYIYIYTVFILTISIHEVIYTLPTTLRISSFNIFFFLEKFRKQSFSCGEWCGGRAPRIPPAVQCNPGTFPLCHPLPPSPPATHEIPTIWLSVTILAIFTLFQQRISLRLCFVSLFILSSYCKIS